VSRAWIVCAGDELVSGEVTDSNGPRLASFLQEYGIRVDRIVSVGDETREILAELSRATAMADLAIVTGGLGPTSDDRTREALAMLSGSEPVFDEDLWKQIQKHAGRPLSGSNRSQAYRPPVFSPLVNPAGTAPGLAGEIGGCRVVALPGPPHELRAMIDAHAARIVEDLVGSLPPATTVSCFGIPESQLEDALLEFAQSGENSGGALTWHTRAGGGRILLRLSGGDAPARERNIAHLRSIFGPERLAAGEATLAGEVVREMARRGFTLAAAESCTGGIVGAMVTAIPGSSDVFWGSAVTYANDAKVTMLGVETAALGTHGAVSEEVVKAMAQGVRARAAADCAVAISGVAGPGGGTPEKPVGTVWIALDAESGGTARCLSLSGDRERVRRSAARESLILVRSWLALLDSQ
jgi:nicotinamide-nucleotide amidase